MDLGTAEKFHFKVASMSGSCSKARPGRSPSRGCRFGTANNLAGATLAAFDTPTAQVLLGEVGKFDNVMSRQAGADKATVQQAIARALPRGEEVVTGQTVINEATSDVSQALGFLTHGAVGVSPSSRCSWARSPLSTRSSIIVGQRHA